MRPSCESRKLSDKGQLWAHMDLQKCIKDAYHIIRKELDHYREKHQGKNDHSDIHVDIRNLRGGYKVLIGVEAVENPYFRC